MDETFHVCVDESLSFYSYMNENCRAYVSTTCRTCVRLAEEEIRMKHVIYV